MQVRVQRTSPMPHNVQVWVDDQPGEFVVWVDATLITEEGARLMSAVLTEAQNSSPGCAERPHLRFHIG